MKTIPLEERLDILRALDHERKWYSLDDKRICAVCDRAFTGRQIEFRHVRGSGYRAVCPTIDCPGDIRHWFLCETGAARPTAPALPTTGEAIFFTPEYSA